MTVRDEVADMGSAMAPTSEERAAVRGLASDIQRDIKALVQQEVALAKAEIGSQAGKVGKGAGMLGGAGFCALMMIVFLSTALWWGLANVMDQGWAALIVAGVWALLTTVLALIGRATLKSISLKPERTLRSLKQLPGALQGR